MRARSLQLLLQGLDIGRRRAGLGGGLAAGAGLEHRQFVLRLLELRGGVAELVAQALFHALAGRGLLGMGGVGGGAGHQQRGGQGNAGEERMGHGVLLRNGR
ncbi:hypothetical protein D3C85_1502760 [compost metagenome]